MCNPDMHAVGVVVGDVFPVYRARTQRDAAVGHKCFERVGFQLVRIGRHHFGDMRKAFLETDKDKALEDFLLDRVEAVRSLVEIFKALPFRHAGQASVEAVAPGVIGAHQPVAARAARLGCDFGGAMAADIVEAAKCPRFIAQCDDPLAQHIQGDIVAGVWRVGDVTHNVPGLAKDLLALQLEELRVAIDPGGEAGGGQIQGLRDSCFTASLIRNMVSVAMTLAVPLVPGGET